MITWLQRNIDIQRCVRHRVFTEIYFTHQIKIITFNYYILPYLQNLCQTAATRCTANEGSGMVSKISHWNNDRVDSLTTKTQHISDHVIMHLSKYHIYVNTTIISYHSYMFGPCMMYLTFSNIKFACIWTLCIICISSVLTYKYW